MREMHVSNLLALHVPNALPESVFGFDTPYLRPAGRLIWSSLILIIGIVVIFAMTRIPKRSDEPATWAATVVGAMVVWALMILAYGTIPHEWLNFASSYLNFNKARFIVEEGQLPGNMPPFDIPTSAFVDAVAAGMYIVFIGLNIYLFSAWQKRKVAAPASEVEGEAPSEPTTGGGAFSRLRRKDKRTSAYGRPVTTTSE
jgi:hypothetical protein